MVSMPPRILLAALLAGIGLASACTPAPERADVARAAAQTALERGDRSAALAAVEDLRASLPPGADATAEVARFLVAAGDAPRAGWLLEEGLRRFPDHQELRLALARTALLLGNPSRAREVLDLAQPDSARQADTLVLRAQAELQLGDLEKALETLEETERLHPDRPEARLVRIGALLGERRMDEARRAIEAARATLGGEEHADARRGLEVVLAQIQAEQGEHDAAIATLRALVEARPDDLLAWHALVRVLVQQERTNEALDLVAGALSEDSGIALHPLAAELRASLGREDAAQQTLREFVARSDSPAAYLPLVAHLSDRDDGVAILAALDEAVARFPDEAALAVLRTEALLGVDRADEARAELERFRELTFAHDPQIEYLRARVELSEGEARRAGERLRKLAPRLDDARTQFWLGRALEEAGDLEGARRRYGLALGRDPTWIAPPIALLALEERRGNWRSVAGHARALVARAPQRIEGWVALVEALALLGQGEAAEQAARRSIERFPGRAEPRVLLARALRARGRTEQALVELDLAQRAGTDVAVERVLTLGLAGRVGEGLALGREALARGSESAELHAALASLLFAAGDAEEGDRETDRALALDPRGLQPLRGRCEFRVSTGRLAGARDDCARYLGERPDDPGASFMLGLALAGLGESESAIEAYRRAAQLDLDDARPRNNLAELLAARGDLEGALAAAQEAYRLDERNPHVMDTLGALYLEKGLVERAMSLLEDAHAALPDDPGPALHLALAYRDAGRTDAARTLLASLEGKEVADPVLQARVEEAWLSLR